MKKRHSTGKVGFIVALVALGAQGQPTYPGCENLAASQFKVTELFNKTGSPAAATTDPNISEPVQMDVHGVYNGTVLSHVDIYFVERLGKVKHYDGLTKKVTAIGDIPVWGRYDNGLMGIALSPDFNTTRLVYFWYSPRIDNATANRRLRLSRIQLKTDKTLDMASEQILIDILASKTDEWHSGGPMQFDAHGDLWITIGNNSRDLNNNGDLSKPPIFTHYSKTDSSASAEWGSSNTASMRGGIIRIHPDTSIKGYSIPADNFGEYWAKQFESRGNAALAAEYRNPQKVLPEVYVKGSRSNFSLTVHPTQRWVAWGEVNYANTFDELNLIDRPTFTGFPYFHGNNTRIFGQQEVLGYVQDSLSPRNTSPLNTGVITLPPAKAAIKTNLVNVVMGGPFYFFDRSLVSSTKFPPHFHNTWLTSSFNGGLWLHELDTAAMVIKQTHNLIPGIFTAVRLRNYVQSKYGPDGSLYILNYSGNQYGAASNPGIMRVDYSGSCIPVSIEPPITPNDQRNNFRSSEGITFTSGQFIIASAGLHRFEITTLSGEIIYSRDGRNGKAYALTALRRELLLPEGTFIVRIRHARGIYARIVSVL
jgi:glucose/arabinose dehydrogenase